MQGYISRKYEKIILDDLKHFPGVALLGPRQCGKSTLIQHLGSKIKNLLYLDLESPSDLKKLDEPEVFFESNRNRTVCLDEIQRKPEIFPVLRSIIDRNKKNGQLIILGSASRDLIRQSSESLAGRISYIEITPFLLEEISSSYDDAMRLWERGGFPLSYLAPDNGQSVRWRNNFIRTFLERDIPQLGFSIPSTNIERLWQMCAHSHGQVLNSSRLGESMGVSYHTVRNYIEILEQTFMVRLLRPHESNLKKRMVKSPKIYIRDTGILHSLLRISDFNELMGHPVYGFSWEGFVIENILSFLPEWQGSFYKASGGAEIDLILEKGLKKTAVEIKASSAPDVPRGFYSALDDLKIKEAWIIAPVKDSYKAAKNITVSNIEAFFEAV